MTIVLHELRRSKTSLIIWSSVISFMLAITIIIYPEMAAAMDEFSEMFSNMGSFSEAFSMDQLNFGEFMGYFGTECGNVLGLGGAFFAALAGVLSLAKEEKDHTAEFLFTHPISRRRVVTEKLASVASQITILNLAVALVCSVCIVAINVEVSPGKIFLIFLAYYIMQLEIGALTFALSALLRSGGAVGIGIGAAFGFYFINIFANLMEELEFLKFITPFGYTDAAYIISEGTLDFKYMAVGVVLSAIAVFFAYHKYEKKDLS